jgi:hypothetical protein
VSVSVPRRSVWLGAAAIACAAAAWNAWSNSGRLCGPIEDETLLLPIAMRETGLAPFPGDRWLATVAPVFSVPYSWIVGTLLRFFDDPVVALRCLAVPFHAVFLAGTWRLAERFAGRAAAAIAVAVCVLPPLRGLVLAPGAALPRDLVFALLPRFVLGADAARDRPRAAIALFVALGAVANLHPLTALHAALWLLFVELIRAPSPAGVGRAAVRGLAFVGGASPYVIQYLTRPAAQGAADETVYAWRLASMAGETWGPWATRMEPLLWIGAAAVFVLAATRRESGAPPRWFVAASAAAFAVAALGPVAGRWIVPLRALQFGRLERFADWCAAILLAAGVAAAWRGRRFAALGAATAFVAVALFGLGIAGDAAGRGPLGRVGRAIDRRAGVPFAPAAPEGLVTRPVTEDPTSASNRDAFLSVCRFARDETSPGALYLVPPEHWGPFRVYARRAVAVTRKEGGAALSFLGAAGMDWYRDFAEAARVYASSDPAAWAGLARTWRASYAVLDASVAAPPPWSVVFESGRLRVLVVPAN